MKNCIAIPKLLHILRTAPTWLCPSDLKNFDETIGAGLCIITNSDLGDAAWDQATLSVRIGGLGIRRTAELSLPAFLVSAFSVRGLINLILPRADLCSVTTEAVEFCSAESGGARQNQEDRWRQKSWDDVIVHKRFNALLSCSSGSEQPHVVLLHPEKKRVSG